MVYLQHKLFTSKVVIEVSDAKKQRPNTSSQSWCTVVPDPIVSGCHKPPGEGSLGGTAARQLPKPGLKHPFVAQKGESGPATSVLHRSVEQSSDVRNILVVPRSIQWFGDALAQKIRQAAGV